MADNTTLTDLVLNGQMAVNSRNASGQTALYLACCQPDKLQLVKQLLQMGAHVNARTAKRWTSLHASVRYSTTDMVALLLSHGACVNRSTNRRMTPLMMAAQCGQLDKAELLITHGCDIEAKDMYGRSSLHWAIKGKCLPIVQLLQKNGVNMFACDSFHKNATFQCVRRNALDILKYLIQEGLCRNIEDNNRRKCLHMAATLGRSECIVELVCHKFSVNERNSNDRTPLTFAICHRQPTTAQLLVDLGADVDAVDENGSSALIHLLLSRLVIRHRPIGQQSSLWMRLAMILLRANADMSIQTRWPVFHERLTRDHTQHALELALKAGFTDLVDLLLLSGSDIGNLSTYLHLQTMELPSCVSQKADLWSTIKKHFTCVRSLKDLCRITVRSRLPRGKNFVNFVRSLSLPSSVQDILLLEDIQHILQHNFKTDISIDHKEVKLDEKESEYEYEASVYDSDEHCDAEIIDSD